MPNPAVPPATGVLWSVQSLRAAAALMVVVGHSQSMVAALKAEVGDGFGRSTILPWGAGVDLFFVISGFIMVHASGRLFGRPGAARAFARRRLARIVPLYWVATTAFLLLLLAAHWKGGDPLPGAGGVLASYLFWPVDTWGDGRVMPVFDLGWTLNYEMLFYMLFAMGVAFPRRAAVGLVAAAVAALVLAGSFVPPELEALRFWTRPLMLDFAFGLGVGLAAAEGVRLPVAARLGLVAGGAALLSLDVMQVYQGPPGFTTPNEWPRVLGGGAPAAALLAGAVLGPEPRMPAALRPVERLGDASYSLYLFHPFALIATEKAWQKLPATHALPGYALVLAAVAGAIALATLAFRWVERPLTRAARRLLGDLPAGPRRAPSAIARNTAP